MCVCVCECGFVCAGCGTVWSRFEGVRVQQVALWCVGKCVFVLRVGQFGAGFGELSCSRWLCGVFVSVCVCVCVCCVWYS